MSWLEAEDWSYPGGWTNPMVSAERARYYCEQLERGQIVFFSSMPFDLPEADRNFLLGQKQSGFKGHKNVSYRPRHDVLRGAASDDAEQTRRLRDIMRRYSKQATDFLSRFLAPYASHMTIDFASYRPLEEQGRDLPVHKRNDLLHVDAFPSRPTNGGRILRLFTNVNPDAPRIWKVTDRFEAVARKFAEDAGLPKFARLAKSPIRPFTRAVAPLLKAVGVPDRSPYDRFMLHFHDYLKESQEYQEQWPQDRIEFPPYSTWIVYTDAVPHAALSGQFALEQTYIVPMIGQVLPERSPIRVLESLCGQALSN